MWSAAGIHPDEGASWSQLMLTARHAGKEAVEWRLGFEQGWQLMHQGGGKAGSRRPGRAASRLAQMPS